MIEAEALKIRNAAVWLAAQAESQPKIIHQLREKFDITAVQAAKACTLANDVRRGASARESRD